MIKKVETVFIRISDIKHSENWYQKVLRRPVKWKKPGIVAFDLGETDITLVQQELENTKDVIFNLLSDDLTEFREHLLSLGIDVSTVKVWENLRYLSFQDPDHNKIEVIERMES